MKNKLIQLIAAAALALGIFAAPVPAEAAPSYNKIIDVTYCWSLTTFGPNGCNAQWDSEPIQLIGGNNSGSAVWSNAGAGTYKFTNARNNLKMEWINPEPGINRVTYTGARYTGGGQNCYRGPMTADFTTNPDISGVWFGCIRP